MSPGWRSVACAVLCLGAALAASAHAAPGAAPPEETVWAADAPLSAIATNGDRTLIGGDFTHVGRVTPTNAVLDADDGHVLSTIRGLPPLYSVVTDRHGGWYLGGEGGILHKLPDGSIDPAFKVETTYKNYDQTESELGSAGGMALSPDGSRLLFGGHFTHVNGTERSGVAMVDPATGAVTDWRPPRGTLTSGVWADDGSTIYATGVIPPDTDNYAVASIDARTGEVLAKRTVARYHDLTIGGTAGSVVYTASSCFEACSDGAVTAYAAPDLHVVWSDETDSGVGVILHGDRLYAFGRFEHIAGHARGGSVALRASDGVPLDWDPGFLGGGPVAFSPDGAVLYLTDQSAPERHLVAVSTVDGHRLPWTSGHAAGLAVSDDGRTMQAVLGSSWSVDPVKREGGALLDRDGRALPWLPPGPVPPGPESPDGEGLGPLIPTAAAIAEDDSFYLAGDRGYGYLPELLGYAPDGSLRWRKKLEAPVTDMQLGADDATVYLAGGFDRFDGQARTKLAAVRARDGALLPWAPNVDGPVSALLVSRDRQRIYLGGEFETVDGTSGHAYLAAVDKAGALTSFDADADASIGDLAMPADGRTLYAQGGFGHIGGQDRSSLAALDATSGRANAFTTDQGFGQSLAVTPDGRMLFVGGTEPYWLPAVVAISTRNGQALRVQPTDLLHEWDRYDVRLAVAPDGSALHVGSSVTTWGSGNGSPPYRNAYYTRFHLPLDPAAEPSPPDSPGPEPAPPDSPAADPVDAPPTAPTPAPAPAASGPSSAPVPPAAPAGPELASANSFTAPPSAPRLDRLPSLRVLAVRGLRVQIAVTDARTLRVTVFRCRARCTSRRFVGAETFAIRPGRLTVVPSRPRRPVRGGRYEIVLRAPGAAPVRVEVVVPRRA